MQNSTIIKEDLDIQSGIESPDTDQCMCPIHKIAAVTYCKECKRPNCALCCTNNETCSHHSIITLSELEESLKTELESEIIKLENCFNDSKTQNIKVKEINDFIEIIEDFHNIKLDITKSLKKKKIHFLASKFEGTKSKLSSFDKGFPEAFKKVGELINNKDYKLEEEERKYEKLANSYNDVWEDLRVAHENNRGGMILMTLFLVLSCLLGLCLFANNCINKDLKQKIQGLEKQNSLFNQEIINWRAEYETCKGIEASITKENFDLKEKLETCFNLTETQQKVFEKLNKEKMGLPYFVPLPLVMVASTILLLFVAKHQKRY